MLVETIHDGDEHETYDDRVECREYPDVYDDQSRNLVFEQKSRREIDESDIGHEPEKAPMDHFLQSLEYRLIWLIRIEMSIREDHSPKYDPKKYKWCKLTLTDEGNTELDEGNSIGDRPEKVTHEKESRDSDEFHAKGNERDGDITSFHVLKHTESFTFFKNILEKLELPSIVHIRDLIILTLTITPSL